MRITMGEINMAAQALQAIGSAKWDAQLATFVETAQRRLEPAFRQYQKGISLLAEEYGETIPPLTYDKKGVKAAAKALDIEEAELTDKLDHKCLALGEQEVRSERGMEAIREYMRKEIEVDLIPVSPRALDGRDIPINILRPLFWMMALPEED